MRKTDHHQRLGEIAGNRDEPHALSKTISLEYSIEEGIVTNTGCRDDVAEGLVKMLWNASQLDDQSDFEDLLDAIHVLRPRWTGASTVVAWRHMRRQEWMDARRVLENADADVSRSAMCAALMAVCLFGLEDPVWHSYARVAAEQHENVEAARIGNRLLERAAKAGVAAQPQGGAAEAALAAPLGIVEDRSSVVSSMMWVRV
jgi:type III secretion protein HrpB1